VGEAVFLVEAMTTSGRISEAYPEYEDARRRAEAIPAEELLTAVIIYQELPDGSQRVVRDDGKPLQAHRHAMPGAEEEPLPLAEENVPLGELRAVYTPQDEAEKGEADPMPVRRRWRPEDDEPPLPVM
jgi:hypothetical protein